METAMVTIYEGTVYVEEESGKVYLFSNGGVIDINQYISKLVSENVKITIEK